MFSFHGLLLIWFKRLFTQSSAQDVLVSAPIRRGMNVRTFYSVVPGTNKECRLWTGTPFRENLVV